MPKAAFLCSSKWGVSQESARQGCRREGSPPGQRRRCREMMPRYGGQQVPGGQPGGPGVVSKMDSNGLRRDVENRWQFWELFAGKKIERKKKTNINSRVFKKL